MGLVIINSLALLSILGAGVYALTRVLALLIVLRGTTPEQRPELVRALAELFRAPRRTVTTRRQDDEP